MGRGLALCVLAVLCVASTVRAEQYALVIGIGKYPYCAHLKKPDGSRGIDLEGPKPDALKLIELLKSKFDYRDESIFLLLDESATRKAILEGIDRLIEKSRPGDQVLIYFSGHGTSSFEAGGGFGMEPHTGAIVPADIRLDVPAEQVLAHLIVGKRDLRPRLIRLEQKAEVLVIFDSCFAGESVKGLQTVRLASPRFISLADLTREGVSSRSIKDAENINVRTRSAGDYPYSRVVYFAAAGHEQAQDIGADAIRVLAGRFRPVDGQPHGAFSNVLLERMSQLASGSHCADLFQAVRDGVLQQSQLTGLPKQTPQLLEPAVGNIAASRACFGGRGVSVEPVTSSIWSDLERLAAAGGKNLACRTSKPSYLAGESTMLSCTAPSDGYVTVLSYGEGDSGAVVLLPNQREQTAAVRKGEFRIPGAASWSIGNYLPKNADRQRQLMVVLFDTSPIDVRKLGLSEGIFTTLPQSAIPAVRSQIVVSYDAVSLVFPIEKARR